MKPDFSSIVGHKEALTALKTYTQHPEHIHAWLFHGPESVGKYLTARCLVAAITDTSPDALSSHPDIATIHTEEPRISVEDIRELGRFFSRRPFQASKNCAIINDAHKMTTAAQNALLKTLEEPAADGLLILVTSQPESLLPTIRSRTAARRFGRVSRQEMETVSSLGEPWLTLADGRPGRYIAFEDAELRQNMQEQLDEVRTFLDSSVLYRLASIEGWRKQKAKDRSFWQQWIKLLIHESRQRKVYNGLDTALDAERQLGRNGNIPLALEHIAIHLPTHS